MNENCYPCCWSIELCRNREGHRGVHRGLWGRHAQRNDLPPSGPGLQVAPDLVMWSWHWRASLAALGKAGNRILEQGLQLSAHSPELTRALCRWGVPQLVWLWGAVGKGCTVCKAFPFTSIMDKLNVQRRCLFSCSPVRILPHSIYYLITVWPWALSFSEPQFLNL